MMDVNEQNGLNTERNVCNRCQGNGLIYADFKAHYYFEHYPSIPCPDCDGEGYVKEE